LDLCVPEQREAIGNAFRGAFRRQGFAIDTTILTATGERRDLFISGAPEIQDGEVVGISCIARDITDRKEAEKAVAHLAAIVTSSDDAIIGQDPHGIVTSWNHGAERLFGYAAKEMIGLPVLRLIPPERHDEESHILRQIMQGNAINNYETIRRCKDGTE